MWTKNLETFHLWEILISVWISNKLKKVIFLFRTKLLYLNSVLFPWYFEGLLFRMQQWSTKLFNRQFFYGWMGWISRVIWTSRFFLKMWRLWSLLNKKGRSLTVTRYWKNGLRIFGFYINYLKILIKITNLFILPVPLDY